MVDKENKVGGALFGATQWNVPPVMLVSLEFENLHNLIDSTHYILSALQLFHAVLMILFTCGQLSTPMFVFPCLLGESKTQFGI